MRASYIPIPAHHNNRNYRDDIAWRHRRAIKVYPTSDPQDIARCYETISRGIYTHNLKLAKMNPYKYERRQYYMYGNLTYFPSAKDPAPICPEKIERQLVGRRVPKRQMRGGPAARRKKNMCTAIKRGRACDLGGPKSKKVVSNQQSDDRSKAGKHQISCQNRFVENCASWSGTCQRWIEEDDFEDDDFEKGSRKRIEKESVEDSDWIDVDNNYVLNIEVESDEVEDYIWL